MVDFLCQCRICHEEEEESSTAMESPCACSGSLKYAHRSCIQRWCEEKSSILCEICLQNFEPNYVLPPKMALLDVHVTIRSSLEIPRLNYDDGEEEDDGEAGDGAAAADFPACDAVTEGKGFSYCRAVTVVLTVFLLARHLLTVLSVGVADQYAFTLLTVFALRASGILLPFFLVMRLISAVQRAKWRHHHRQNRPYQVEDSGMEGMGEEEMLRQHVIEIRA